MAYYALLVQETKKHNWNTKKLCAVYGEIAVTDWTCQKFVKFPAGDFSLDDAPQLGRPVEVDSKQIETLIENNQHYTTTEMADIFKWKSFTPAWLC